MEMGFKGRPQNCRKAGSLTRELTPGRAASVFQLWHWQAGAPEEMVWPLGTYVLENEKQGE